MNIREINKKVDEVQNKLAFYGLPKIQLTIEIADIGDRAAGQAFIGKNNIKISSKYLKEFPDHVMNVTVAHEVVHLYVFKYFPRAKQAHGPEFRRVMRLLGLAGDTYHKMKLSDAKPRQKRTKVRFLYVTEKTNQVVGLTPGQHKKVIAGIGEFRYKGEKLKFTNEKKEI